MRTSYTLKHISWVAPEMMLTSSYLWKSIKFYSSVELLFESTVCLFNVLNL